MCLDECLIMSYNENVKKNVAFKHDKASQYFFKLVLLSISDKNQKNNSHKTLATDAEIPWLAVCHESYRCAVSKQKRRDHVNYIITVIF